MRHLSLELVELIAEHCGSTGDIARLSCVNKTCHAAATRVLYRTVAIRGPRQYASFMGHLERFRSLGYLAHVRRLDLSSYTVRGSGWTEAKAKAILDPNVLAKLLIHCVHLTELMVGEEMMQAFVAPVVVRAMFTGHLRLQVLDFSGFCDRKFTDAMANVFNQKADTTVVSTTEKPPPPPPPTKEPLDVLLWHASRTAAATVPSQLPETIIMPPRLSRISFHMCMALTESAFFIPFFQRLTSVTRIDLAHTKISNKLFDYINPDLLTHLNLQGCHGLSCCSRFVDFVTRCHRLQELNLNMDLNGMAGTNFCHACLVRIVSSLPRHLRVLNLGGHAQLDHRILELVPTTSLRYLSISCNPLITVDQLIPLLKRWPNLLYLCLTRTSISYHFQNLAKLLSSLPSKELSVIEVNNAGLYYPTRYPQDWRLVHHGRRSYYSRDPVDPRFCYSNKLLLQDEIPTSPMTKYWCYSC